MDIVYLRKLIKEVVSKQLRESEKESKNKDSREKISKQVMSFMNSLQKSSVAKKLKQIDTDAEKIEIMLKFAEIVDFPKDKISKLSLELRSKK